MIDSVGADISREILKTAEKPKFSFRAKVEIVETGEKKNDVLQNANKLCDKGKLASVT